MLREKNQNGTSGRMGSGISRGYALSAMQKNKETWQEPLVEGGGCVPAFSSLTSASGPLFLLAVCPSFLSLAHGTCPLILPGPGYSQAPPNSDRPSELPGLHGQTVWVPPVLAVQLGYWGQRLQPDMLPKEK